MRASRVREKSSGLEESKPLVRSASEAQPRVGVLAKSSSALNFVFTTITVVVATIDTSDQTSVVSYRKKLVRLCERSRELFIFRLQQVATRALNSRELYLTTEAFIVLN